MLACEEHVRKLMSIHTEIYQFVIIVAANFVNMCVCLKLRLPYNNFIHKFIFNWKQTGSSQSNHDRIFDTSNGFCDTCAQKQNKHMWSVIEHKMTDYSQRTIQHCQTFSLISFLNVPWYKYCFNNDHCEHKTNTVIIWSWHLDYTYLFAQL